MNALAELNMLLSPVIPVETVNFTKKAPEEYAVLVPLIDEDSLFGDDDPEYEVQEVRISVFTKTNYTKLKTRLVKLLRRADFTITEKRFIDHEDDTGYYHYAIDVAKIYESEV